MITDTLIDDAEADGVIPEIRLPALSLTSSANPAAFAPEIPIFGLLNTIEATSPTNLKLLVA